MQRLLGIEELTSGDILEIRHILRGGSIIDWPKLHFRSLPAVNEFLRCAQYDPDNRLDAERLVEIHRGAIEYIRSVLRIDVPNVLAHPHRIQNVFLYASSDGPHRGRACMILKVMHVINHLEARELLYHLPVSEREFFARVEARVTAIVGDMQEVGLPVDSYQASQKTKESLITKLLSKRKDTAAQVFDRIRFRIITASRQGIIPILYYLKSHLLAFPFVIPGESANTITSLTSLLTETTGQAFPEESGDGAKPGTNPFSHKEFRVVSFVVDIPVRVDDLADPASRRLLTKFGHLVYIPTEFQLFDKATYFLNESGPAAHEQYKRRQLSEVIARLYVGSETAAKEDGDPPTGTAR
jgi:uncharacterized protein (TIGR04552 family)